MRKNMLISYHDALEVIRRLLDVSAKQHAPFTEPIVMLGGTAMVAHHIRKLSYDVDMYVYDFSDDVVHQVERELKQQFGDDFKIDVTSVENIWGDIMLRDLAQSETDSVIRAGDRDITIRKLSIEDLFLVKLDTGREKDRDDLEILYEKTNPDKLIRRFNVIWKWHGNRDAVLGYADSFVALLSRLSGLAPSSILAGLKLPEYMLQLLNDTWGQDKDNNR